MLPQWYQKPKGIEEGCIIFLFSKNISLGSSNAFFSMSFRHKVAEINASKDFSHATCPTMEPYFLCFLTFFIKKAKFSNIQIDRSQWIFIEMTSKKVRWNRQDLYGKWPKYCHTKTDPPLRGGVRSYGLRTIYQKNIFSPNNPKNTFLNFFWHSETGKHDFSIWNYFL